MNKMACQICSTVDSKPGKLQKSTELHRLVLPLPLAHIHKKKKKKKKKKIAAYFLLTSSDESCSKLPTCV